MEHNCSNHFEPICSWCHAGIREENAKLRAEVERLTVEGEKDYDGMHTGNA